MNFDYSDKVQELRTKLARFLDEYIYTNEATYLAQIREALNEQTRCN